MRAAIRDLLDKLSPASTPSAPTPSAPTAAAPATPAAATKAGLLGGLFDKYMEIQDKVTDLHHRAAMCDLLLATAALL